MLQYPQLIHPLKNITMDYYELTILASPDLTEEELNKLKESAISVLQEEGGVVSESNSPSKKTLGAQIKGKNIAFLLVFSFSSPSEQIKSLEEKLRKLPEIMRFLLVKRPAPGKEMRKSPRRIREAVPKIEAEKKPKVEFEEIEKKLDEILGQ